MLKTLLPIFVLSIALSASADEIYLNNHSMIKGTVVKVTENEVRYHPEGQEVDNIIPKDLVEKIIYGKKDAVKVPPDRIVLYDGFAIAGKVKHIALRYITYIPCKSKTEMFVDRSLADKIIFGDGKVLQLNSKDADPVTALDLK